MKKFYKPFIACLIILIASNGLSLAQGWRQAANYSMEPLYGVHFISETVGFCVGGSSVPTVAVVYKTTDGGGSWKEVYNDLSSKTLQRVYFVSNSTGYACGLGGKLIKTTNGGTSWTDIPVPAATSDLLSLYFQNENTGWVLSNSGVLRTSNGGATWTSVLSLSGATMYDMHFWGGTHGVITGKTTGDTYYTKDGITWTKAATPVLKAPYTRSDIRGVYAVSDSAVYGGGWGSLAVSQPTIIVKSTDGGATWTQLLPEERQRLFDNIYAFYFKDANNGLAIGGGSRSTIAVRTTDGGLNWTPVNIPSGGALRHACGIGNNIWAVSENGFVVRSRDFGNTWDVSAGIPKLTMYGIQFASANTVFAAGSDGGILKSADGGKTWSAKFINTNNVSTRINDLFFVNEKTGYTAHSYKRVCKTTDGGNTWTEVISDTTSNAAYSMGLFFLNENHGYVVGRLASKVDVIYKTTDGGKTWDIRSNIFQANLRAVAFSGANNGIVVGEGLKAGYTTDGGATWKASTFITPAASTVKHLKKVVFTNPTTALAIGDAVIVMSTDAGATWNDVSPAGLGESLEGLVFQDQQKGWAAGTKTVSKKNTVFETADGGKTWKDIADTNVIKPNYTIFGMTLDAGKKLWLSCSEGAIFTNSPVTEVEYVRNSIPSDFVLKQNYPNPFNPETVIGFSIPEDAEVKLEIFDVLGKQVALLINEVKSAGSYNLRFDGKELPSGIYIYTIQAGKFRDTKKLMLLK